MKNKKIYLMIAVFIIALSLYPLVDAMAMENMPEEPDSETAEEPDFVSSGAEFINWMESHKSSGGSLKLTDNIVLDKDYDFIPYWVDMPPILVDTGSYGITVNAVVNFMGVNALTFQGREGTHSIFHVSAGGALYLNGVSLQGIHPQTAPQHMIWQEEGAALIINDCHIDGSVHYADAPIVMESSDACVIVESGQSADDMLPPEIECKVNYQGTVYRRKMLPVVWDMAGTQQRQAERVRFQVKGSYPGAFFLEAPVCTVVYNDYFLTFLDAQASMSRNFYIFRGNYTKPEKYLPITLISEHSFDKENWTIDDESMVSDPAGGFYIAIKYDEWDTAQHPYIYIRLRFQHDGVDYFSNILRFAADNLNVAEDHGGTRGGGTSITNPPDEPQEAASDEQPESDEKAEVISDEQSESDEKAEVISDEQPESDEKTEAVSDEQFVPDAKTEAVSDGQSVPDAKPETAPNALSAPVAEINPNPGTGLPNLESAVTEETAPKANAKSAVSPESAAKAEVEPEPTPMPSQKLTVQQDEKPDQNAAIVIGFVTLSAAAGAVGFGVHLVRNK